MLMMINLLLSTTFSTSKNPILMIINLMLFTILVSIKSFFIHNNAWYSYTILLIMIGGMMVIFIYMTSTLPNKKIKFPTTNMIIAMTMIMIMPHQKTMSLNQNLMNNPMLEFNMNINTLTLAIYLLLTLIIINKTTFHFEGPMRAMN